MDFIVGSFNHDLYTLHFQPPSTLTILRSHPSIGGHSWLALSPTKTHLYCTAWTKPHPSLAAYKIAQSGRHLAFLNAVRVQAPPATSA
ncbi:Muconate cycloisomerase 1 [Teratosphaeria destructans]|uniref:Muconate cycloisomerase 1 n=1 Tax=Teratosphaeria destructans TaxID=418781 RepID=A0A9W7SJA5_9PEZI|nr:Muconate cycloisomerase 1 [Teratosphaeria destructans]